jgi:hypothetical protein
LISELRKAALIDALELSLRSGVSSALEYAVELLRADVARLSEPLLSEHALVSAITSSVPLAAEVPEPSLPLLCAPPVPAIVPPPPDGFLLEGPRYDMAPCTPEGSGVSQDELDERARRYIVICLQRGRSISLAALRLIADWDKARANRETQALWAEAKAGSAEAVIKDAEAAEEADAQHEARVGEESENESEETPVAETKRAPRTPLTDDARERMRMGQARRRARELEGKA